LLLQEKYNKFDVDSSELFLCQQNLLTATVLWDDIYINIDRTKSNDYCAITRLHEILGDESFAHFISLDSYDIRDLSDSEIYNKLVDILTNNGDIINFKERSYMLWRGGLYLMKANSTGLAYLPHPYRAKLLYDSGIFPRKFDGRVYLDIIDKEVREYIEAINELAQFQLLSTSFPILYEFISKIAKDPLDEFRIALELREEKNVSLFRKSVNEISEEVKKGNIHALRASLMKTKEICDEITASLYKKPLSYGVSIGLSPSIEIGRDHNPKVASGFHTTFLSDLANFALKGDIAKHYMLER